MAKRLPRGTIARSAFGVYGDPTLKGDYALRTPGDRTLRQLRRRVAGQKTIRLYRGISTHNNNPKARNTPHRIRGAAAGSSWTSSIGAARDFARMGITSGLSRAAMIYAIDVPADQIRSSLNKIEGRGSRTIQDTASGAKKSGAKWAIGSDEGMGYIELRPTSDVRIKPKIVQTLTGSNHDDIRLSRVNHEGWFQSGGGPAGGSKGKLAKGKGGGGGGG